MRRNSLTVKSVCLYETLDSYREEMCLLTKKSKKTIFRMIVFSMHFDVKKEFLPICVLAKFWWTKHLFHKFDNFAGPSNPPRPMVSLSTWITKITWQ